MVATLLIGVFAPEYTESILRLQEWITGPTRARDPERENDWMRSDAQANRDRVLAAAEEVFGESGKAGSTEEVARRAGVGIGTVFRHFPTKQLLIEATIVRHLTLLTNTARARGEDSEAGAAFRMTFREMVSGAPAKLALVALLEESAAPAGAPDEVKAAASVLRDAVAVLLSRGQEAGEVRADATVDEIYVLIRALANARGDRAVVDRAVDMVLDGLSQRCCV
jgi:AcrR family transcriptional regulator